MNNWQIPDKTYAPEPGDIVFLCERYCGVVYQITDHGFSVAPYKDGVRGRGTYSWWSTNQVLAFIPSPMRNQDDLMLGLFTLIADRDELLNG